MIGLVTTAPWDRIQSLVNKQPGRCHVAVAYFGSGASKLLPLKTGSVLVIDMSERGREIGPDEAIGGFETSTERCGSA
jgi:hypothetical protein